MAFPKSLNQLCTPAYIYFILSILMIIISAIENMGNNSRYTLGMFSCPVPSCLLVFAIKILYILFWTWVLNLMCKDGHSGIAWFVLLIPFILLFLALGMLMMYQNRHQKQQKH
jgi:hypothetical protein